MPLARTCCPGVDGFLAQQFGHILMGGLLVAAQIDKGIGISDDALPVILEKCLQLADILQDDGSHDITGAHGCL